MYRPIAKAAAWGCTATIEIPCPKKGNMHHCTNFGALATLIRTRINFKVACLINGINQDEQIATKRRITEDCTVFFITKKGWANQFKVVQKILDIYAANGFYRYMT